MEVNNWSYKTCKAPVKMSPSTNQKPVLYRPDALPVAQLKPNTTIINKLKSSSFKNMNKLHTAVTQKYIITTAQIISD